MSAPISALVVRVPEAEALVRDLRERHDPSAADGVPAHVTVLVPFLAPADATAADTEALRALFGCQPAFDAVFARVGRFPATAWLAPEPAAPFIALTGALVARWPQCRPYGGAFGPVVPHLTAADGSAAAADAVEHELRRRLAAHGPVRARCREVEWIDNRGGRFERRAVFALGAAPGAAQ